MYHLIYRSLDSSLTANKHVQHGHFTPSSMTNPTHPKLARGVSAAPASNVHLGYVTAIICGAVISVLIIIGKSGSSDNSAYYCRRVCGLQNLACTCQWIFVIYT